MNFLMSREGMIPRNNNLASMTLRSLVVFMLFMQGCGLNDYPYIYAPDTTSLSGTPGIIKIYNRDDNDPDVFQGYELYYKFYEFSSDTTNMASDYKSLFSVEEPEPSNLTTLGFKRINTVSTTDKKTTYPMIYIDHSDRDSEFTITLDFSDVAASVKNPTVNYLSYPEITLYRTVVDPDDTDNYKSFIYDDLSNTEDSDISHNRVTLSLFVFSYGKYDNVYNIYSRPVWLGYIQYDTLLN